jgi:hypothetical protein
MYFVSNPCTVHNCPYCSPRRNSIDTMLPYVSCPYKYKPIFERIEKVLKDLPEPRIRNKKLLGFDSKQRKQNRWR